MSTSATTQQAQEFAQVLEGRNAMYRFLGRLYRTEVDEELLDALRAMRFPTNTTNEKVNHGYRMMVDYLNETSGDLLTLLAIDYVHAFIGSGNTGYSAAYPFESVYTSPKRLLMQNARDEVLVIYRAAGLEKQESWREGEDHIALELEYEAILGERALDAYQAGDEDACAAILEQSLNFLEDHLCAWYPMMAADMQKFPRTDFYRGLGELTEGFLDVDIATLRDVLDVSEDAEDSVQVTDIPAKE